VRVSELAGTVLAGKYSLENALGKGNFGTVYRAREVLDGQLVREVALKLYSPEATRLGTVEGMLADCSLPARILSSDAPLDVKRHFAQIYDFGQMDTPAGRCAYVALELIRGAETLEDVIERYRASDRHPRAEMVIDYATQFFTALAAAHAAGVLHRDIKGANVMIDSGVVRVMDFGMGARLDQPDAALKTTMSIYAPENFEGRYTAASDVYQAGLMFYELYTGIAPFVRHGIEASAPVDMLVERKKRMDFRYVPGRAIPGVHWSEVLDAVLARCLEYSEVARYGSARAVLDALRHTDTAATAESALALGDPRTAQQLAEQALANPDIDDAKRVTCLRTLAAAHEALGDQDEALKRYKEAIALAEATGVLFHDTAAFNTLVDAAVRLHLARGQAGMARLMGRKRR
jgi:serine/threonine-protein kinase